jgi:vancomycin resistance protein YoaR
MIFGGVLIPSIGGGVCQTATTIFNAAFEAGLPVSERHNHSWYITHYPMGRDATVSWGGPDLVFKNDLKHAILIDVSYTDTTFTISFYGTKQGRKVTSTTADPTKYTQPKMRAAGPASTRTSTARSTSTGSSSGRTTSSPATPLRTRRRCTAPAASRPVLTSSCRPAVRAVRVRPA